MFDNTRSSQFNIYERDWRNFDQKNFILIYFSKDCEDLLVINELNVGNSTHIYSEKLILSSTLHLRIYKYKLRFRSKP